MPGPDQATLMWWGLRGQVVLALPPPFRQSAAMEAQSQSTLARRLGKTQHTSPLRFKLASLCRAHPMGHASCIEDWLLATANARGARVVTPAREPGTMAAPPPRDVLSDEDLVVAMCQINCLDRPQMLRPAAQLISRGKLNVRRLQRIAIRERAEPVLAELCRQALKVAPDHAAWRTIHERFHDQRPLREPLLHWTRLAEPVMEHGKPNAVAWRLVA